MDKASSVTPWERWLLEASISFDEVLRRVPFLELETFYHEKKELWATLARELIPQLPYGFNGSEETAHTFAQVYSALKLGMQNPDMFVRCYFGIVAEMQQKDHPYRRLLPDLKIVACKDPQIQKIKVFYKACREKNISKTIAMFSEFHLTPEQIFSILNGSKGFALIMCAVERNLPQSVRVLSKAGLDFENQISPLMTVKMLDGVTPVSMSLFDIPELCDSIKRIGGRPDQIFQIFNEPNDKGEPLLAFICGEPKVADQLHRIIRSFLAADMDFTRHIIPLITAENIGGVTPLMFNAYHGDISQTVEVMGNVGGTPHQVIHLLGDKNKSNFTPIMAAMYKKDQQFDRIIGALRSIGASQLQVDGLLKQEFKNAVQVDDFLIRLQSATVFQKSMQLSRQPDTSKVVDISQAYVIRSRRDRMHR